MKAQWMWERAVSAPPERKETYEKETVVICSSVSSFCRKLPPTGGSIESGSLCGWGRTLHRPNLFESVRRHMWEHLTEA